VLHNERTVGTGIRGDTRCGRDNSDSKWTVYRLAALKRKTGSAALRTKERISVCIRKIPDITSKWQIEQENRKRKQATAPYAIACYIQRDWAETPQGKQSIKGTPEDRRSKRKFR